MTQEVNIIEDNKLIDKFMGVDFMNKQIFIARYPKDFINNSDCYKCFHNSWDWLMPVVEKIEGLYEGGICVIIKDARCLMEFGTQLSLTPRYKDFEMPNFYSGFCKSKIEAVYKAVVEFIKWYNQNK